MSGAAPRGAVYTPVGWLVVDANAEGLTAASFEAERPADANDDPHGAITALSAWLAGAHGALDGVAIAPIGSDFQRIVWRLLRTIPAGQARTYGELAVALGRPTATRAVARANATNPVAVIVPCHRVIGSDGAMRGYAGGLHRKRWLLAHEGAPGFLVP
ncbi:MAG: methylated-DNA-[protein]-cysteine S-methyltransferase [Bradymonadia bacterium]